MFGSGAVIALSKDISSELRLVTCDFVRERDSPEPRYLFGRGAANTFSTKFLTDWFLASFAGKDAFREGDPKETRRLVFDGRKEEALENVLVGDDGIVWLGIQTEGLVGGGNEGRRSSFGEREDMLDIDIAGEDGTEGFDMAIEEAREVGVLIAALSNTGKEKSREVVPRDKRRMSSSKANVECIFEPSGILESLSKLPRRPFSDTKCEIMCEFSCTASECA